MLTINGRNDLVSPAASNGHPTVKKTRNNFVGNISITAMPEAQTHATPQLRRERQHIWMVTGPAGCGKTTVASYLAKQLGVRYLEGDDYHPTANKQKMSQNIPLTDMDRWDWLITLREAAVAALQEYPKAPGVVVTCSALKRKYRDVIRIAAYNDHEVLVHFIYLHASEQVLLTRVAARQGHYMGVGMVHSQVASLEIPGQQELKDVITCDCSGTIVDVERQVLATVRAQLNTEEESPHPDEAW